MLCGAEKSEEVIADITSKDFSSTPTSHPQSMPSSINSARMSPDKISRKASKYYVPDFSLRVDDKCVYLKLDRELWRNGVIKSQYEKNNHELTDNIDYSPSNDEESADMELVNSTVNSPFTFTNNKKITGLTANYQPKGGRRQTIAAGPVDKYNTRMPLTPNSQKSRNQFYNLPLNEQNESDLTSRLKNDKSDRSISRYPDEDKDENSNLLPKHNNIIQSVSIGIDEQESFLSNQIDSSTGHRINLQNNN